MQAQKSNFPDDKFKKTNNPPEGISDEGKGTETSDESFSSENASDDDDGFGQIPIRPRQRFTTEETNYLESVYKKFERPTGQVKQELAEKFNTTVPRIQIWFQNRRAKAKKMSTTQPDPILEDGSSEPARNLSKSDEHSSALKRSSSSGSQDALPAHLSRKRQKAKKEPADQPGSSGTSLSRGPNAPPTLTIGYPYPGYQNPGFPNPSYSGPGLHNPTYSSWIPAEFIAPISPTSESPGNPGRFMPGPRNPEGYYRLHPDNARLFQQLQHAYPALIPQAFQQHYNPNYTNLASIEHHPGSSGVTSYVDPQKMTYSRGNDSPSVGTDRPFSDLYTPDGEDETEDSSSKGLT